MKKTLTHKEVESYILARPTAELSYPFGEGVAVYKAGFDERAKMFALIAEGKSPVRLSLKCDPQLATLLREKYDEVQPGYHLNKKNWNTIVLSGQLSEQEVKDLIDLSYRLVVGGMNKQDQDRLEGRT